MILISPAKDFQSKQLTETLLLQSLQAKGDDKFAKSLSKLSPKDIKA